MQTHLLKIAEQFRCGLSIAVGYRNAIRLTGIVRFESRALHSRALAGRGAVATGIAAGFARRRFGGGGEEASV